MLNWLNIGVDLSEARLERIMKESSFSAMSSSAATNLGWKQAKGFSFYNKGKIGQWREHFTVAQNDWFDQEIQGKLRGTGLEFIYK